MENAALREKDGVRGGLNRGGMLSLPEQLAGVKVFPCMPGDKVPALSYAWQTRATDDAQQVAEWSSQMADLNWGVAAGPSGLFVIDVDPQGIEHWQAMQEADPQLKEAVAKSFTVKTPRGGFHHYFKGLGPTTASAIGPGIDTRGGYYDDKTGKLKSIGYVVAPGSRTAIGEYVALGGVVDHMPEAVRRIVPEKKKGQVLGLVRDPKKDQPRNVQWARDLLNNYVKEGRVSVEGNGGNNTAFQVAASLLDKAISPALVFELMDEMWNPHCVPPWEDFELERIVENATKYGEETEGGAKGFEDNQSAFAKFAGYGGGDASADDVQPAPARRRERVRWMDDYAASVEDPVWLLPGVIPARGIGMFFGASGSYKSFIALDWACCLAHGHAGQWGAPPVQNDVLYFAGEAPIGTAKQRRPAWLEWQSPKNPSRLAVFPRVPHLGDVDGWAGVKADIEELGMKPRLIVIDTLTRLLTGFDENSSKDATKTTGFLEELAAYYECFVLVVHHTGKDESRGARGSSAFFANMDTVLSVKKKGQGSYFQVRKHKDADAPEDQTYMRVKQVGKSIVLEKGNDDGVSDIPEKGTKISWSDAKEITARLARNGGRLSNAILCQEIAGDLTLDRQRVNRELRNRQDIQWLRDGDTWRIPAHDQEFDL